MSTLIHILLSTALVSSISLVGVVFLSMSERVLNRLLFMLVAFASGALLGGALLHLIPECYKGSSVFFGYVLLGIILFFVIEKFLRWRHCHKEKCDVHAFAYLNLVGDAIHNLIDGMIIAASFVASGDLGIVTSIAVIIHEVPQEIGDFGILVYGGLGRMKALYYNFVSQATAILGAVLTYYLANYVENLVSLLLPLAAGGFIYIAATDLFPELQKKERFKESSAQLVLILLGIILMWFLKVIFG